MLYIVRAYDEGDLFEYEYGCVDHAMEHMRMEKAEKVEVWEYSFKTQKETKLASR